MTKLPLIAASAALLALAGSVAAHAAPATQTVSVTGKTASTVSAELLAAARQVCGATLKHGPRNPNYASCVAETLGQARADYAALRSAAANPAE
jgi:hypothetical protein